MGKNSERGSYASPEGSAVHEYLAAMSCSTMLFSVGCILGWNSPALAVLMGPNTPMAYTDSDASSAAIMFGSGFGLAPMLTPLMANKLGRRNTLLAISIPMIINWGLIAVAKDPKVLFIARFIAGLAASLGICISPMYMGEIASVKLRGALAIVICSMITAGVLSLFLSMPYLTLSTSACVCLSVTTVSMITLWFIPESPYFLTMVGRIDEAEDALEKLRGKTDVAEELDLIKKTISPEDRKEGQDREQDRRGKFHSLKQLILVPGNRRAFYINFILVLVLHLGGSIVTVAFSEMIFRAMKTTILANICASMIVIIQLVVNILTTFVVDRLGRRPLICVSGLVSGACVLAVGIYFYLMEYTEMDVTPYSAIPLGLVFLNTVAVNFGLFPLQMVIQSETLDTEIKAFVTCLLGMSGGCMSIVGSEMYLKLTITWGFGHSILFFVFCVVTWISTALVLKMLPETKGKTFLEIQKDLNA